MIKIVESPRDGLQGIKNFIPTEKKIEYINLLLEIGFDIIDFGSFVSPKVFPQMVDSGEVVDNLNDSETKLLAIVPNLKGAEDACRHDKISYIGFPFSISNTFLERNIKSNINVSYNRAIEIIEESKNRDKGTIIYFSMGFGNPYEDKWSIELLDKYIYLFVKNKVKIISLSDTIGCSRPEQIYEVFDYFINEYPDIEFGFHLHTEKDQYYDRLKSAYDAGVRRFDSVVGGLGGCPSALLNGQLMSNLQTNDLVDFCSKENIDINLNLDKLAEANNFLEKIINI